jgi:hypothetical protein
MRAVRSSAPNSPSSGASSVSFGSSSCGTIEATSRRYVSGFLSISALSAFPPPVFHDRYSSAKNACPSFCRVEPLGRPFGFPLCPGWNCHRFTGLSALLTLRRPRYHLVFECLAEKETGSRSHWQRNHLISAAWPDLSFRLPAAPNSAGQCSLRRLNFFSKHRSHVHGLVVLGWYSDAG